MQFKRHQEIFCTDTFYITGKCEEKGHIGCVFLILDSFHMQYANKLIPVYLINTIPIPSTSHHQNCMQHPQISSLVPHPPPSLLILISVTSQILELRQPHLLQLQSDPYSVN